MSAKVRALAWRFVDGGPEIIGRTILSLRQGDSSNKLKPCIDRLIKPISKREELKWENKDLTPYQWDQLCSDPYAAEFFEALINRKNFYDN